MYQYSYNPPTSRVVTSKTTTTEEFDSEGNLVKRTTVSEETTSYPGQYYTVNNSYSSGTTET